MMPAGVIGRVKIHNKKRKGSAIHAVLQSLLCGKKKNIAIMKSETGLSKFTIRNACNTLYFRSALDHELLYTRCGNTHRRMSWWTITKYGRQYFAEIDCMEDER